MFYDLCLNLQSQKLANSGSKALLVVRVNYANANANLCDTTCIQNIMWDGALNVNGMYRESSYNNMGFDKNLGNQPHLHYLDFEKQLIDTIFIVCVCVCVIMAL
jgi:deoxyribodipyrimidine photolyase